MLSRRQYSSLHERVPNLRWGLSTVVEASKELGLVFGFSKLRTHLALAMQTLASILSNAAVSPPGWRHLPRDFSSTPSSSRLGTLCFPSSSFPNLGKDEGAGCGFGGAPRDAASPVNFW